MKRNFNVFFLAIFDKITVKLNFSTIQDGSFRGFWRMGGDPKRPPILKICHTYPTMMKLGTVILYLKVIQKLCQSRDTALSSADISIFYWKSAILLYQEIQIKTAFWYLISNSVNFFRVFKDYFNKHGYIFDDISKNGYSSLS